jgi:hypothetical protein
MNNESWKKAAHAVVQHWKTNGPTVSPQWCSDAAKLLELAEKLMSMPDEPVSTETTLQVGDRIKDNDPRMPNRVMTITEILPNGVAARDSLGKLRLYLRRSIYTDGKPRRSGFSLLPPVVSTGWDMQHCFRVGG